MKRSDFQSLALLKSPRELTSEEIYKACAAVANQGVRLEEESHLASPARRLLQARRLFHAGESERAEALLTLEHNEPLYEGDRLFLLANVHHWRGQQREASGLMHNAIVQFERASDPHRELRALINQLICNATLEECLSGELQALEQWALRDGFHDLSALIQRTRALELLRAGRRNEALVEADRSVASFELDGCPEDKYVSLSFAAIIELLLGNLDSARAKRARIFAVDGKASTFVKAYETLAAGHMPQFEKGHPFHGISWRAENLKANSVPSRLVAQLKLGPASRDELITAIWGAQATDPSYRNRLFNALSSARKNFALNILFDGERYRLSK